MTPQDETIQFAMFMSFTDRGIDGDTAKAASTLLHLLVSDVRAAPSRRFEKTYRKAARRLAKQLKRCSPAEATQLIASAPTSMINVLQPVATTHNDEVYLGMLSDIRSGLDGVKQDID